MRWSKLGLAFAPCKSNAVDKLDWHDLRPIILLDIDGVINMFGRLGPTQQHIPPGIPVQYPPQIHASIARLAKLGQLIWCSTWLQLANFGLHSDLGLPELPLIEPLADNPKAILWKLNSVAKHLAEWQKPIIWIEDGFRPQVHSWAQQRSQQGRFTQLIDVRETGLIPQVVDQLEQTLARFAA